MHSILWQGGTIGYLLALLLSAALQSLVFVLLPSFARDMGLHDMQAGLVTGIGALVAMATAIGWGAVAESWGRRQVAVVALAGLSVSAAAFGVIFHAGLAGRWSGAGVFAALVATRILQSILGSGLIPAAEGHIADMTPPAERVRGMGLFAAFLAAGGIVGVALIAMVPSRPDLLFATASLIMVVAIYPIARFRSEPPLRKASPQSPLLRPILPFLTITVLSIACLAMVRQVTSLRLQDEFGFTPVAAAQSTAAILASAAGAMIVGQIGFAGVLRWRPDRLLLWGAFAAIGSTFLLFIATGLAGIAIATTFLGLAFGLLQPGYLTGISWRTTDQAQARAGAANFVSQSLGFAVGPVVGTTLHHIHISLPYFVGVLMMAIVGAIVARTRGDLRRRAALSPSIRSPGRAAHR